MKDKIVLTEGNSTKIFDYNFSTRTFFTLSQQGYTVKLSGGSIAVCDGEGNLLSSRKGFHYLYTGDIRPDGKEVFALENGKHFYVFALPDLSLERRITLPRGLEAIDVYGKYSKDGERLFVPAQRFADGYEYFLCEYETREYSLCNVKHLSEKIFAWPTPRKEN